MGKDHRNCLFEKVFIDGIVGWIFVSVWVASMVICACIGQFNFGAMLAIFLGILLIGFLGGLGIWALAALVESVHDWAVGIRDCIRENKKERREEFYTANRIRS